MNSWVPIDQSSLMIPLPLRWLRGVPGIWPNGLRWASAGLAGLGAFWVVQRLVSPG